MTVIQTLPMRRKGRRPLARHAKGLTQNKPFGEVNLFSRWGYFVTYS
jgi:hypothetical protein